MPSPVTPSAASSQVTCPSAASFHMPLMRTVPGACALIQTGLVEELARFWKRGNS
jgi:hypothetical protein